MTKREQELQAAVNAIEAILLGAGSPDTSLTDDVALIARIVNDLTPPDSLPGEFARPFSVARIDAEDARMRKATAAGDRAAADAARCPFCHEVAATGTHRMIFIAGVRRDCPNVGIRRADWTWPAAEDAWRRLVARQVADDAAPLLGVSFVRPMGVSWETFHAVRASILADHVKRLTIEGPHGAQKESTE